MTAAVDFADASPGVVGLKWTGTDNRMFELRFRNKATQAAIDISGISFSAGVRRREGDPDLFAFTVAVTDGPGGVLQITCPTDANLPESGIWALRWNNAGAQETILEGPVIIGKPVVPAP